MTFASPALSKLNKIAAGHTAMRLLPDTGRKPSPGVHVCLAEL